MLKFIDEQPFLKGEGEILEKLDVQKLKAIVKELTDLKFALDQSSIVAITDHEGKITYANQTFCDISQYTYEELVGEDHRIVNARYHPKEFFNNMWQTIQKGEVWRSDIKNRAKDGSFYWVKTTIVPFLNEQGIPNQYISIRQDITAQKELEEKITYNLYHDEMTGLRNKLCFQEEVSQWIEEDGRTESLALIFLDLDRFKYINDTLGHTAGDEILKAVSKRFVHHFGKEAEVYRFGGDEFIIVLKHCSREQVNHYVERIFDLFATPFSLYRKEYLLTVSLGISFYPEDGTDIETLLKNTDNALYLAKEKGNNVIEFYTQDMHKNLEKTLHIEHALRQAITNQEFVLHYQPQMDLKTGKIVGVEALIRWNHPELGLIGPFEFITLAEDTGLIIPITEWVLETACKQNRQWQELGLPPIRMAVNLSPQLFKRMNVYQLVADSLEKSGLHPKFLDLEITESIMEDMEDTLRVLQHLKELGVSLSIDDFGTGYSSLAHLRRFPIDTLKIDRSFVIDIPNDHGVMVKTIINLATNLGLNVVAEGIETEDQLESLEGLRCHYGQGYLISHPISSHDLYELLVREKKNTDVIKDAEEF